MIETVFYSAGQDYTSVGSTLTFSSGQTQVGPGSLMCVNIPIIDDVLCELQESFEVSVASDPDVELNGQLGGLFGTFISLLDNDGKFRVNETHNMPCSIRCMKACHLLFRWCC